MTKKSAGLTEPNRMGLERFWKDFGKILERFLKIGKIFENWKKLEKINVQKMSQKNKCPKKCP